MSTVIIRRANKNDVNGIMKLIHELAIFEKSADKVKIDAETLLRDGFPNDPQTAPLFTTFVAEDQNTAELIGMALCFTAYSTWEGRVFHLEDLIVSAERRGEGVGTQLLKMAAKEAMETGAARFEWQVIDWNEPARRFYKAVGATELPEWITCRMHREDVQRFMDMA